MTGTMRAVVLDAPDPPEVPMATPRPREVLIAVGAFGLDRSEPPGAPLSAAEPL